MRDADGSARGPAGETQAFYSHTPKLEQVSHNLPEHKNVDEKLDRAWRGWKSTFDAIKDSIILIDGEFKIIQANLASSQLFGRPLDQIIGKTCWQLVHGTNEAPEECPLKRAKTTKKHEQIELYLPEKNIWIEALVSPVFDQQGNLSGAVHIIRDITGRKQMEEFLRKERDKAQKYLDVAGVMFVAIDSEQRVGLINKKGCEILGYSEEEVIAKNWFDNFLPEKVREQVKAVFEKTVHGEIDSLEYYENPILTKDGQERLIAWHNTILRDDKGQFIATLSSGEDITERKRAEKALRESEEMFRSIFETSLVGVAICSTDKKWLYVNNQICKILGYSEKELLQTTWDKLTHPDDLEADISQYNRLLAGEIENYKLEKRFIRKDNSVVYARIYISCKRNQNGAVEYDVGLLEDITKRKKAEEALKETEIYLRTVLSNAPITIFAIDNQGLFTLSEGKGLEKVGLKPGENVGVSALDLYGTLSFTEDNGRVTTGKDIIQRVFAGETIYAIDELRGVYFDNIIAPMRDAESKIIGIVGVATDITERKKAEQKLIEYQAQLKSLASQLTLVEERERRRLATKLHDRISQSLVSSKIELDALRQSVSPKKPDRILKEVSDSLGKALDDMRTLTFDLSFPILYELGFEAAVAAWLVDQIQEKHGITTEFEEDKQPKPLDDDVRVLLFRDVRELLINVVKHANAKKVKVSIRKVGSEMYVSVEDDGRGFDTKKVAATAAKKGGFGLFSIRERLEQLGGHLEIESAPGCGTKATLIAPLKQKSK
jgi:PAS domain S-box-containing protein